MGRMFVSRLCCTTGSSHLAWPHGDSAIWGFKGHISVSKFSSVLWTLLLVSIVLVNSAVVLAAAHLHVFFISSRTPVTWLLDVTLSVGCWCVDSPQFFYACLWTVSVIRLSSIRLFFCSLIWLNPLWHISYLRRRLISTSRRSYEPFICILCHISLCREHTCKTCLVSPCLRGSPSLIVPIDLSTSFVPAKCRLNAS